MSQACWQRGEGDKPPATSRRRRFGLSPDPRAAPNGVPGGGASLMACWNVCGCSRCRKDASAGSDFARHANGWMDRLPPSCGFRKFWPPRFAGRRAVAAAAGRPLPGDTRPPAGAQQRCAGNRAGGLEVRPVAALDADAGNKSIGPPAGRRKCCNSWAAGWTCVECGKRGPVEADKTTGVRARFVAPTPPGAHTERTAA